MSTATTTPSTPGAIGRLIDVTATLTRVIVVCDGTAVGDHERSWATGGVVTDPAHMVTAKGLRSVFSPAKRDRERAGLTPTQRRVMFRNPGDYDDLFGVRFDAQTGQAL